MLEIAWQCLSSDWFLPKHHQGRTGTRHTRSVLLIRISAVKFICTANLLLQIVVIQSRWFLKLNELLCQFLGYFITVSSPPNAAFIPIQIEWMFDSWRPWERHWKERIILFICFLCFKAFVVANQVLSSISPHLFSYWLNKWLNENSGACPGLDPFHKV